MDEAALRCGAAFASCHRGKLEAWSFEADQRRSLDPGAE